MCSLRFENNFLTIGHVRFRFKNSFLAIERVRFASKINFVLTNVFASFRKWLAYCQRCSLRFDIEENTIIEAFVCFRFASVAITTKYTPPVLNKYIAVGEGMVASSNGNASETKANEIFDNGVFFDIEAKWTPSLESKLFLKRSEHIKWNKNNFRSEANTFDTKTTVFKAKANTSVNKKIIFGAKRTH